MSVIIKTSEMQYRDQLGNYHGVNAIAEKKIADQVADLDTAITAQESRIAQDISAAQTAVNGIDAQRQTMIASIASVAGQGTDTTLTQSGVAADAKSAGDEIRNVKNVFALETETIPDTVQTIAFDSFGNVQSITHTRNNVVVRTDVFTFGVNTITEVRTLSTGESLTIVTNMDTLAITITYADAA